MLKYLVFLFCANLLMANDNEILKQQKIDFENEITILSNQWPHLIRVDFIEGGTLLIDKSLIVEIIDEGKNKQTNKKCLVKVSSNSGEYIIQKHYSVLPGISLRMTDKFENGFALADIICIPNNGIVIGKINIGKSHFEYIFSNRLSERKFRTFKKQYDEKQKRLLDIKQPIEYIGKWVNGKDLLSQYKPFFIQLYNENNVQYFLDKGNFGNDKFDNDLKNIINTTITYYQDPECKILGGKISFNSKYFIIGQSDLSLLIESSIGISGYIKLKTIPDPTGWGPAEIPIFDKD